MRSIGTSLLLGLPSILLAACVSTAFTAPTATPNAAPDLMARGREVYARACAECHGERGQGYAGHPAASPLDDTGHAWHHPDQQIYGWIVSGKLGLASEGMPALGDRLTDREVEAVIAYLHSLWTKEQLETQQDVSTRYPTAPTSSPAP